MPAVEPNEIEKFVNEINEGSIGIMAIPGQDKPRLFISRDEQGNATGAWFALTFKQPSGRAVHCNFEVPCDPESRMRFRYTEQA
ncbi:MAG: hypothetical protein ABFD89_28865 [Bryobacteraceae bacterium]